MACMLALFVDVRMRLSRSTRNGVGRILEAYVQGVLLTKYKKSD